MDEVNRPILSLVGNALFGVVGALIVLMIAGLTVLPPLLHYQTYVVLSGSMSPTLPIGSVVVSVATAPEKLQVGDVITFVRPGDHENITHRIVGIQNTPSGRMFVTKGDANGVADAGELRYNGQGGRMVFSVPYMGYFFKFVGSPSARLFFIVVPGVLLLGMWLWEVWRPQPPDRPADIELPAGLSSPGAPPPPAALSKGTVANREVSSDASALPLRQ